MSVEPSTGFAIALSSFTAASRACSMPARIAMAFAPFVRVFIPSRTIASRRTVVVVVPSPATSLDFVATSFTISAPMFSNLSLKEISFAIETPSFVMRGPP